MLLAWLAALALAHPFGADSAAHQTEIRVDAERVRVTYAAEVPDAVLRANGRLRPGADPVAVTTTELLSGLVLTVDGEPCALSVEGPAEVTAGSASHVITVQLAAPLSPTARELRWTQSNLPEVPAFSTARVWVDPGWAVLSSDLLELANGRVIRDRTDQWRRGDEGRTVSVSLQRRPPIDRLARWLTGGTGVPAPLAEAVVVPGAWWWRRPIGGAEVLGSMLAVSLLGAGTRSGARGLVMVGALAAIAPWVPSSSAVDVAFGAAVLGGVAIGARSERPLAAWVAIAAATLGAGAWRLALAYAACAGAGHLLGKQAPPDLTRATSRAAALALASWWLLRGLRGLFLE